MKIASTDKASSYSLAVQCTQGREGERREEGESGKRERKGKGRKGGRGEWAEREKVCTRL